MNVIPPRRQTVDEFLLWLQKQDEGHFELERGRIVVMQAENTGHAKTKVRIYNALVRGVEQSGVAYYALPDGPRVRIGTDRSYEPDALIAPLPEVADDALEIPDPIAVFEVLSPTATSTRRDLNEKVVGYALAATIQHYVIVDPAERIVLHYRRRGDVMVPSDAPIEDVLRLDAVGIEIPVTDILGPAAPPANAHT